MVFPFTFVLCEPAPSKPALLTEAADPDDMDRTCVRFRVVSGTDVIALLSTTVPPEDIAWLSWHRQATRSSAEPGSSCAFSTACSETFTTTEIREFLNP